MLNPDYIPDEVLSDLLEARGLPDDESGYEDISKLSANEAFTRWLNYNGIIGYGHKILVAIDGLREAEKEAQTQSQE